MFNFIKTQPVAKFYYKGNHSHPIRRTLLIVEQDENLITGYELREGTVVRMLKNAPIKSFRKDKIAKVNEIDLRRKLRKETIKQQLEKSTLIRKSLQELIIVGP